MTTKDRAADLRLRRLYGITLVEYNRQLKKQGSCCAICRRPPAKNRLAVDHNHKVERAKVTARRSFDVWVATAPSEGVGSYMHTTKAAAVAEVKLILKRRSVRGLLCMVCNRKVLGAMERFKVRPDAVIEYLQQYDPANPLVGKV